MSKILHLDGLDAKRAAQELYHALVKCAKMAGQSETECILSSPKESEENEYPPHWRVLWESGPSDWGVSLAMGEQPFAEEFGLEVKGFSTEKWFMEPYWGFDVGFVD